MESNLALNCGNWDHLFHWQRESVNFSFLYGALEFWDPTDHVFHFGLDELYATYEEFAWFLG